MNSTTKIIAGVAVFALLFAGIGFAAEDYKGTTESTDNEVNSQYVVLTMTKYSATFTFDGKLKYDTKTVGGTSGPETTYYLPVNANEIESDIVAVTITPNVVGDSGETYAISGALISAMVDQTDVKATLFGDDGIVVKVYSDSSGQSEISEVTVPAGETSATVYVKVIATEKNAESYTSPIDEAVADGTVKIAVSLTAVHNDA